MTDRAQSNSIWQSIVRQDLRDGWGAEDIAVRRAYDLEAVRSEIAILRESGELQKILRRE